MTSKFDPKKWLKPADDAGFSKIQPSFPKDSDTWDKTEKVVSNIEQFNVDLTSDYSDWIKIGYAFANEFGENGRDFFHRVSQFYHGYSRKECDEKYSYFLSNANGKSSIATFFYYAKLSNMQYRQN
jgi:hypothetical protein